MAHVSLCSNINFLLPPNEQHWLDRHWLVYMFRKISCYAYLLSAANPPPSPPPPTPIQTASYLKQEEPVIHSPVLSVSQCSLLSVGAAGEKKKIRDRAEVARKWILLR